MTRLKITIVSPFVIIVLTLLPLVNSGKNSTFFLSADKRTITTVTDNSVSTAVDLLYDSLQLEKFGLKKEAFIYAYTGSKNLSEKAVFNYID